MNKKRVVVTGLGAVTSIGIGKDAFWNNLIQGKSGISEVDAFDTKEHFHHYGGQMKNFQAEEFLTKNKIKLMGKASHLAIAAAKLALKDAGLKNSDLENSAVLMGTTVGEGQKMEEIDAVWLKKGKDAVDIWSILQYPVNNISSNLALELKARGINRMFTTACAAGNYAIGYGFDLLQLGKADIVIAGGSDAFSYVAFTGFSQVRAMAVKICQPFDKNRKGMLVGEGAGVLTLETLESALERGALIYAEILGYGLSCDAAHMTNPSPDGVAMCMQDALAKTNLKPEEIDYVCAHGTGTIHNDQAESIAINRVFNNRKVPVSSIKSMLGHTMGAASALETIACCLAVKNDILPPTINFATPDPECDIDCVPNKARKQKNNIVINNGFAFGGNNACLVIKKFNY